MGARCELCIETEVDPNVVCQRPDTPLVQGRKVYRNGRDKWELIEEKMEKCPVYMLFKGTDEIIETGEVIRLKPRVQEVTNLPQEVKVAEVALVAVG